MSAEKERLTRAVILNQVVQPALKQGMKTAWWLLKLTIPVSFGVFLAGYLGILAVVARMTEPLFVRFGLPGEASVVLITSYFTNIYSVIAVMATLELSLREALILANMCLIAHSLIVETGIQRKTGTPAWRMIWLRLTASFLAAWILNGTLPAFSGTLATIETPVNESFSGSFTTWLATIGITSLKIVVLVNLLLIFQKFLQKTNWLEWLVKPFHPLMNLMGLPKETSFLWLVANTLGLSYGGAIMISQAYGGELKPGDAGLLNHHIAVSHSQLEDTLLFSAMGFSIPWLVFPRFMLAVAFTWLYRLEIRLHRLVRPSLHQAGDT